MEKMYVDSFVIRNESRITKIQVHVVFGSSKQNCADSGICRVFVLPEQQKEASDSCNCENKVNCQLLFDQVKGVIGFGFDSSFVHTKTWKSLFYDFYFSLDEDWVSSPSINTRLQIRPVLLKKGVYPVMISDQGIRVWFENDIRVVTSSHESYEESYAPHNGTHCYA